MNTLTLQSNTSAETPPRELSPTSTPRTTYHELPGLRHETRDVLKQLESNIRLLEDLGGRLSFMLTEVRTLIRR